jgi:hypothetical protein
MTVNEGYSGGVVGKVGLTKKQTSGEEKENPHRYFFVYIVCILF